MRILIVGSGGREHALAWKLAQENEVMVCPGNPGIASVCETRDVAVKDHSAVVAIARGFQPDLVVVGPEDPLIAGLADDLRDSGFAVFGPGREGARLEGSKAFCKELMKAAGVPTAEFGAFSDAEAAIAFAQQREAAGRRVVVKASGAALGKGVVVCGSLDEAVAAINFMLEGGLGEAGRTVVIEDRLGGTEFSLLTMVSGSHFRSLPVAQDYKRIFDNDEGPNTGGMGSYSPVEWVKPDLVARTEDRVVRPILQELVARGIEYRGLLFSGLMVEDGEPWCLEYNVRFGDPETQSVMQRLGKGFDDALLACAHGQPIPEFEVLDNAAVTVVMASEGYPASPKTGREIQVGQVPAGVTVFHAGTKQSGGQLLASGGRVLAVSAVAGAKEEARTLAYAGVDAIQFEGAHWRRDIAQ